MGFVRLVDVMPRVSYEENITTCDFAIAQAARTGYASGTKTINEDKGLIRYLMRHRHTTPFEMVEFKFHMKLPIYCARQIIRHRTASVNEESGRYSILKDDFHIFTPEEIRIQSSTNKQCSEGEANYVDAETFVSQLNEITEKAYQYYEEAVAKGIGREQARAILPVNIYTSWYWKIDCWNLLHFLALRCDKHAQKETQMFGNAILDLITPLVPWTIEAWNEYHPMRDAIILTAKEVAELKKQITIYQLDEFGHRSSLKENDVILNSGNKREDAEWLEKAKILGLT